MNSESEEVRVTIQVVFGKCASESVSWILRYLDDLCSDLVLRSLAR